MIATIEGRMNRGGVWWDVTFEVTLSPDLPSDKKIERLARTIDALASKGVISRVAPIQVDNKAASSPLAPPTDDPPMSQAEAIGPQPFCPTHREAMSVSKIQPHEGYVYFYCTKKGDEGYCRFRAKTEKDTGLPSFWETKK